MKKVVTHSSFNIATQVVVKEEIQAINLNEKKTNQVNVMKLSRFNKDESKYAF